MGQEATIDFRSLVEEYGSPLYVYDFDAIRKRFDELKDAFKGRKAIIAYAVKANSNLSLLHLFSTLESGADCVSIGEVKRAHEAGIPKYKTIFSGVGKTDDEITQALTMDILFINVESEGELERIETIAKNTGKPARISIRVNPDIDPKTHPYISTGLHENKFGVDIETAKRLYLRCKNSPHLEPVGIHFHIGSQLLELEPIREAAAKIAELTRNLQALDIDIRFFDIGGGLGIDYDGEETITPYDYAQAILKELGGLDVTIICEPGRFLVGNAGYFLTRVLYEKQTPDKRFVVVDGAMNDLLRPSLYQAYHRIESLEAKGEARSTDIVGPICESGDFLGKNVPLGDVVHHDILIVRSAGAYGMSMASNYNSRVRPAEVAIMEGRPILIRAREEFEAMIDEEKQQLQIFKEAMA